MDQTDVTIIGAGVSGLTCARHLLAAGLQVQILEARHRAGGRLLTAETSPYPVPAELGAEFIHGAPPALLELFKEHGLTFVDSADEHLFRKGKSLVNKASFWEEMESITKKLDQDRLPDRSVSEFLTSLKKKPSREVAKLFQAYVEGFQAADMSLIGERSLAENEQAEDADLQGVELFRPLGGYHLLVQKMLTTPIEGKPNGLADLLSFNALVKEVRWATNQTEVFYQQDGRNLKLRSKAVVITLPLGVLKAPESHAGVAFTPPIPTLDKALTMLQPGYVHRITFEFKSRFWESLHDKGISFLHTGPEHFFPTWWTQWPVRSPLLIAWQGGPKALELSQMSAEQRQEEALKTLHLLTGKSKAFLSKELVQTHSHDWNHDPYSLGAYSYTGVQTTQAIATLRKPVDGTVIFAGEATAPGTSQGTVHGALESGQRAAKQILNIFKS